MKFQVAFLAGMLALTSSAKAEQDDPAITVCELAIKEHIKTPKSYERVSAGVFAHEVTIKFDAVNEYNAPIRSSETCEFYKSSPTEVAMVPFEARGLIKLGEDLKARIPTIKTVEDGEKLQKEAQAAQMQVMNMMVKDASFALQVRKILPYPIALHKTSVKPLDKLPIPQ